MELPFALEERKHRSYRAFSVFICDWLSDSVTEFLIRHPFFHRNILSIERFQSFYIFLYIRFLLRLREVIDTPSEVALCDLAIRSRGGQERIGSWIVLDQFPFYRDSVKPVFVRFQPSSGEKDPSFQKPFFLWNAERISVSFFAVFIERNPANAPLLYQ